MNIVLAPAFPVDVQTVPHVLMSHILHRNLLSAEIKRIADQYKMEEDKVRELVNVDDLKKDLAINKAIDFIKSHANVVEKAAEAEKTEDAE